MPRVETVRGPIPPDELGVTICHEHVLIDVTNWMSVLPEVSKRKILMAPVTLDIFGEIKRDIHANRDNLIIDDEALATREVLEYKKWGGRTIVDVTLPGIGRDPQALRRISEEVGINILTSTGWYVQSSMPPIVRERPLQQLSDIMVKELTEGIGDTGIKAGLIGEIGCSVPFTADEEKNLRAAARAQRATGAGMTIHPGLFDFEKKTRAKEGERYLRIAEKEGADLEKIYMSHADTNIDLDYHRKLLKLGVTLSYDTFGEEHYLDSYGPWAASSTDKERVNALVELCKEGYHKQLVMSHDVCMKVHLTKYGGYGFAHVLRHIVPALRYYGVTEKQIRAMLVDNPRRLLTVK